MPHVILDYSANLETRVDFPALLSHLREAALETGVFPLAGIRVRAFAANHVSIADGSDDHSYIHITIRLRGGRTMEDRKRACAHVFEAGRAFLQPVIDSQPFALSLEMVDIDPELSPKLNTIRDHLGKG